MYTNEQVATLIKRQNATLDAILAALRERPLVSAPATLAASSPVVVAEPVAIPDKGERAPRYACSKHADHKGGKGFTVNGRAAHAAWCDGAWSAI